MTSKDEQIRNCERGGERVQERGEKRAAHFERLELPWELHVLRAIPANFVQI